VRLGYAYWGFIADRKFEFGKEVSTPDGNAAYSWSILHEAQKRGWETYLLQRDRDFEYVSGKFHNAFSSFSTEKRYNAWRRSFKTLTTADISLTELDELPELDVLLIEWRFPIPGRNIDIDINDVGYQSDLDRQTQILEYFKGKSTKIILWDLDHKLTLEDEVKWAPDAIFETSVKPLDYGFYRTRVEPPIVVDDLYQFPTLPVSKSRKLVYIGSRYERDDVIDKWIAPVSEAFRFEVEFWGNWTREPNLTECRLKWPYVLYNERITISDFRRVYGTAAACPLLGKQSYLESGFITPRPWEALLFGTIPVGLKPHLGIEDYVEFIADDPNELCFIVENLATISVKERDDIRSKNIEKLRFMDVSNFVDKIENVVNR